MRPWYERRGNRIQWGFPMAAIGQLNVETECFRVAASVTCAIMELYQLKTFLVIARTRNLTRAAAELHASQPTVSGQLKSLEEELGLALFERTARGMKLTEAGQRLCQKAQELIDRATEFTDLAASLAQNAPSRCRVGLNTTATALRVPQLVTVLSEFAPHLHLELHQNQSHAILLDIARGNLDAGFFFGACAQTGLTHAKLAEVDLALVGPEAWSSTLAQASWEELLRSPWVLPPETCPFFRTTTELLSPTGQWPSNRVIADDEATTLGLVRAEAGIALLPTSMLEGERGIAILRPAAAQIALSFAWQAGRTEAPLLQPVLHAIERIWRSSPAATAEPTCP